MEYIDLSYQFGILRLSTFCCFEWFSTKAYRSFIIHTNGGLVFLWKFSIFFKNHIFMNFFYIQSCFLRCLFLGYLDLPYQFGILRMSTFCLLEWFSTKSIRFYNILTNSSEFFYANNFFTKIVFSQNIFQIIWTCLTNLESSGCLLFADLNDFWQNLLQFL